VTQTYLSSKATTSPYIPREASAAGRLRSNAQTVHVKYWEELIGGYKTHIYWRAWPMQEIQMQSF
jgi:hypothetical protein